MREILYSPHSFSHFLRSDFFFEYQKIPGENFWKKSRRKYTCFNETSTSLLFFTPDERKLMTKRAIQMTFVKPDDATVNPYPIVESELDIHEIVKTTIKGAGTLVFGYVILDAVRNILISQFGGKS